MGKKKNGTRKSVAKRAIKGSKAHPRKGPSEEVSGKEGIGSKAKATSQTNKPGALLCGGGTKSRSRGSSRAHGSEFNFFSG
jgi:hypothetical protein